MKRLRVPLFLLPLAIAASLWAQQAPAPAFDVVSIKPAASMASMMAAHQAPHVGTKIDNAHVDIGFASLQELICTAYAVKPYQVTGPDFLTSARFDIAATLPAGADKDQVPQMLQTMLATRFGLTMHRVTKDLPVYALVVGKDGLKMQPAAPAADTPPPTPPPPGAMTLDTGNGTATVSRGAGGRATVMFAGPDGPMTMEVNPDGMHLVASSMTMKALADLLTPMLDRPVVDQTGLTGGYQLSLAVSQADLMAMARVAMARMGMTGAMGMGMQGGTPGAAMGTASDPSGSSIFASVQKLGLALDARKAPIDQIVIDHVEKTPTPN